MKKISFLALGLALAIGVVAEAGSIPTDRVPLKTYAIKKVYCYLQPNGTQKGYIDPGDYVVIEQIRSDGWAYGSYPVGKTRIRRWFKADDLVNNVGFTNQERYSPKANTYTYRNPNHNQQFGSFNDNEPILVVSDYGQSRQFIYKVSSGGYKMAWVPYWDCWDARQAGKQQVNNNTINKNPIVQPVKREEQKQNNNNMSCGCSSSYAGNYVVNTSRLPLTMRSGHGSGYTKIASIPKGATVTVSASNGTWAHVNYNGRDGYASMQYLKKVSSNSSSNSGRNEVNNSTSNKNPIVQPVKREEQKQNNNNMSCGCSASYAGNYTVNTAKLPLTMRSGHGSGYAKITSIPKGATVAVSASNGTWAHVNYNGRDGYASMQYLKKVNSNSFVESNVKQEKYIWPIDGHYTVNTLFYYYHGFYSHSKKKMVYEHSCRYDKFNALDIKADIGTPIVAPASGVVEIPSYQKNGFGNYVIITHADGNKSLFAHLRKENGICVENGAKVSQGQLIGYSGNTDNQSAHIHFEFSNISAWEYFREKVPFYYWKTTKLAYETRCLDKDKERFGSAIEWISNHSTFH